MPTASDLVSQWKVLNREQRDTAMSRMTPQQKFELAAALGYKPPTPGVPAINPEARTAGNYVSEIARGIGRGLRNDTVGVLTSLRHPIDTVNGMQDQLNRAYDDAEKEFVQTKGASLPKRAVAAALTGLEEAPIIGGMVQHAEEGGERMASPESVGAAAEGVTTLEAPDVITRGTRGVARVVPRVVRSTGESLAEVTPHDVAKIVSDTAEKNRAAVAKANAENEAAARDRADTVRSTGEKRAQLRSENEAREGVTSRKAALQHGLRTLDPELKAELQKTEEAVNREANRRYNDLRKVIKDQEAEPYQPADENGRPIGRTVSTLQHLYDVAVEPLRGTEAETPIIKSLGKRIEQGDVGITYNDLQGYREEVGRELRRGSLPPDVFTAYKGLMSAIDDAMSRIAERNGLKAQQDAARAYYRRYAETFLDRTSPVRKALDSAERGEAIDAFRGKDQSGIESLAQFNPELARRFNAAREYSEEEASLHPSRTAPKPEPELPPKTAPVEAETTLLSPETLKGLKAERITKAAERMRSPNRLASTFLGYDLLRNAFDALASAADFKFGTAAKQLLKSVRDVGIRVGYKVGSGKIADLLETPEVRDSLSQITPQDIAQLRKLPSDQQAALSAEFQPLLQAAVQARVPVSPALSAWASGAIAAAGTAQQPRKRVAEALTAVKP